MDHALKAINIVIVAVDSGEIGVSRGTCGNALVGAQHIAMGMATTNPQSVVEVLDAVTVTTCTQQVVDKVVLELDKTVKLLNVGIVDIIL